MHPNKLIVGDFPKNTTIEQELMKYELLNIFYNSGCGNRGLRGHGEEEQELKRRRAGYEEQNRELLFNEPEDAQKETN